MPLILLVIDDDEQHLRLVREILSGDQILIHTAPGGTEGWELFKEKRPRCRVARSSLARCRWNANSCADGRGRSRRGSDEKPLGYPGSKSTINRNSDDISSSLRLAYSWTRPF